MRRKQLGMSPAKIAMAVAVTMEAIAGTGGMKKVTGTSSAVAIVAVSPGTAPTNRPNTAEARITHSTYGSNTSAKAAASVSIGLEGEALEHPPGQRDAQQLVEREVDEDRRHDCHWQRYCRPRAEHQRPPEHQGEPGQVKSQGAGEHYVQRETCDHRDVAGDRAGASGPGAE